MLELSEAILASRYTISIVKEKGIEKDKFVGTYCKKTATGLKIYELPEEELEVFPTLSNIDALLSTGRYVTNTSTRTKLSCYSRQIKNGRSLL